MRIALRDQKTPNEAVPYTLDWTPDLNGSTISGTPTWTVSPTTSPALTVDTQSNTTVSHSIRLSSGQAGTTYLAVSKVTTADSQILEAAIEVQVVG